MTGGQSMVGVFVSVFISDVKFHPQVIATVGIRTQRDTQAS